MNAEKKNFYGWILLVAIGIMFLCSSGFILVGASVVNPLMMADSSMNMNATLMGLGFTLFVLCQGIPAPLIGQFITKYGQKKTFIVGGLLLIIGGLLMAFVVKTTIGYLIAFGVILSIGSQMAGQVTMQTSVSAWFVQKRALAMSIATVIGAIGSFISPRILNSIVASTGRWQNAWLLVAGLGVVVIIIAVALVVDKPSDKGQYPDGIEPGSAVAAAQKFSRVYKTSEVYDHKAVLKNRNFWFIALAATGAFCLYSLNSAAAVKHFTTQGFESAAIVAAVSYMGIANMVGKLSVGPIGDKVEPTRMMAVYLLIIAVGTLCSAFAKSQAMMVAYYLLLGLGFGGVTTTMAIKIENMRNMVYHYAWMKQNGMSIATESAMAKYYTSRAAFEVVDDAMQIMGGIGYTNDVRIARLWRDCRLSRIMAGTDEIMVHIAGRALLKEFANK